MSKNEDRGLESRLLVPKDRTEREFNRPRIFSVKSGQKSVTISGTRVRLSEFPQVYEELNIIAFSTNTGFIYIGDNSVSADNGAVFPPGGSITFNKPVDISTIYIDSSVSGDSVSFIGVI